MGFRWGGRVEALKFYIFPREDANSINSSPPTIWLQKQSTPIKKHVSSKISYSVHMCAILFLLLSLETAIFSDVIKFSLISLILLYHFFLGVISKV